MTITQLRKQEGDRLGFKNNAGVWYGLPEDYRSLDAGEQAQLNAAMKEYIRQHPTEFSPTQLQVANTGDPAGPDNYGLFDALDSFGGEVGNQAERLNPFSAANLPKVKTWLTVGFLIWATVKLAPYAIRPPSKG